LDDVYGLKIDTGMLMKSGKEIQRKLGEVARSYQRMKRAEAKKGTPEAIYT
jgi:predicted ATP-grasp superfamily ATP-dependent carboligase